MTLKVADQPALDSGPKTRTHAQRQNLFVYDCLRWYWLERGQVKWSAVERDSPSVGSDSPDSTRGREWTHKKGRGTRHLPAKALSGIPAPGENTGRR